MSIEQSEAAGRLILLVEDNELNREVLQLQLGVLGYAAVEANDGKQALDLWHQHEFALILTDCYMPEMDGFEFSEQIRQLEQAKQVSEPVPIIAVTANTVQEEWAHCKQSGMNGIITKPLALEELGEELAKWL